MSLKKKLREKFRNEVFKRDNNTCKVCNTKRDDVSLLNAHHITDRSEMPNGGYVKENGITVCEDPCHMKVEKYHINRGLDWIEGLHPMDLYKMIGSSLDLATRKSEDLCQ